MEHDVTNGARSRYRNRTKRKKTNLILNSLIAIVVLLILAVGFSIFAGNDDASPKPAEKTEAGNGTNGGDNSGNPSGNESAGDAADDSTGSDDSGTTEEEPAEEEENGEPVVTEGGSSPNVKRTIENPSWKPAGTTQTGPHEVVTDSNSQDWQDMLNALAYAIETEPSNMTTWWLEKDRSTDNGAIGTVSSKGNDQAYRVYIQWVDGEGYKPVKVEELIENDKR